MAESIDTLQKQVNKLTLILQAQQSGLPARLTIFAPGYSAERVDCLILDRLNQYGLEDKHQAEDAGCEVTVIALPWLIDRQVGKCQSPV
jgi:hypothetical protein